VRRIALTGGPLPWAAAGGTVDPAIDGSSWEEKFYTLGSVTSVVEQVEGKFLAGSLMAAQPDPPDAPDVGVFDQVGEVVKVLKWIWPLIRESQPVMELGNRRSPTRFR